MNTRKEIDKYNKRIGKKWLMGRKKRDKIKWREKGNRSKGKDIKGIENIR